MSRFKEYLINEVNIGQVGKKIDFNIREAKKSLDDIRQAFMNQDKKKMEASKKDVQQKLRDLDKMFSTLYQ